MGPTRKRDLTVAVVTVAVVSYLLVLRLYRWFPPITVWTGLSLLAVAVLGLVSTALANALYFRLVGRMGATQALSVTFLIPPFAMLWGHLLFDERPTLAMLASTVVILIGTALSLGWRRTSAR